MSTLGVSRSGRVRKKSAKIVEMETFDGDAGEDSNRPVTSTASSAVTTYAATAAAAVGHQPQHRSMTAQSPSAVVHHQSGYLDSRDSESISKQPHTALSTARKAATATTAGSRRSTGQNSNNSSQHQHPRQNSHSVNFGNSHGGNSDGAAMTFANNHSNQHNNNNNQLPMDNSSSSSSESESDDSSDNDSDSDELPYPLQKVTAQQMVHLQALQKGRRPKQAAPQRSRQYSSSSTHDYDPPYNPKTGGATAAAAAKISASAASLHKAAPRRPGQQQRPAQHAQHPQHAQHYAQQHQPLRIPAADSEMSSSNDDDDDSDDDDDESDSGDSLIIDSGDGFAKKAPIQKLKLPLAAATALATAQMRQKMQQQQHRQRQNEDGDDEPSEADNDDDDDDDDFLPSSAKRRRSSAQSTASAAPKKTAGPAAAPAPGATVADKKLDGGDKVEPKKPKAPSAYVMYCSDIRKKLLAENPTLTFAELSKRMGQMWNLLPEKDKQLWKRKAKSLQARNAGGLISTGKQQAQAAAAPPQQQLKVKAAAEKKVPPKSQQHQQHQLSTQKAANIATKTKITPPPSVTKSAAATAMAAAAIATKITAKPSLPSGKTMPTKVAQKVAVKKSLPATTASAASAASAATSSSSSSSLQALISNYQELLDKPIEAPPRPFGHSPLDAAAHLKLLGESLTTIGTNLMEHQGPIAVSGSLSVLLDSTLCALGPLVCLTAQLDELDGSQPETLRNILNNIAYIMPGL